MDITLVNASKALDGLTISLLEFRDGLATQGVRARVATCVDPSHEAEYPRGEVQLRGHRFPGGGAAEMALNRFLPVFAKQAAQLPGDLLHVNDVFLARTAAYRDNVVVTILDLGKLATRYYPRSSSWLHNRNLRYLARARGVVCCAPYVQRDIVERLRLPPDRVWTVPLYSRLARVPRPTTAPRPPTSAKPWTLLYVAADRPSKNIEGFLNVLRGLDDRYRGLLVSDPSPRTRRSIEKLGLGRRLEVRGGLSDMTPVYQEAHVLVFPSRFEGWGLPLVEAMSQGRPILASNATSVPNVVGDGGTLLDPDRTGTWVEAVQRLADPAKYLEAAQRSWDRGGTFSPERTGRELLRAYQVALESR